MNGVDTIYSVYHWRYADSNKDLRDLNLSFYYVGWLDYTSMGVWINEQEEYKSKFPEQHWTDSWVIVREHRKTGEIPDERAHWSGITAGHHIHSDGHRTMIEGIADLHFDLGPETIGATFSQLRDANNWDITYDDVVFRGIPVGSRGAFGSMPESGPWIKGYMGGPDHQEIGGGWEYPDDDLSGVFIGKRQ